MIELRGVSKEYNDNLALDNVNLRIEKGEFVFVVGKSGSGKTTLIDLLSGKILPTRGEITVMGVNINRMARKDIPYYRRRLGIVYQDFSRWVLDKTVFGNVSYGLRAIDLPKKKIFEKTESALLKVKLIDEEEEIDKANEHPRNLSTGEQQRVAIARAIAKEPDILLADEPTGNIDPDLTKDVLSAIINVWTTGTTVIFVTQEKAIVDQLERRVVRLSKGQITRDSKGKYRD